MKSWRRTPKFRWCIRYEKCNRQSPTRLPDHIHPNANGAGAITRDHQAASPAIAETSPHRPVSADVVRVMKKLAIACVFLALSISIHGAAPIRYHVTFPEPQHRWMQVEATFPESAQPPWSCE